MPTRLDLARIDLMDALDLAILIEYEAYDRYRGFAAQIGHRFPGDAAGVFASMAENERKHGMELEAQRKERFGDAPRRVTPDDLLDVEAPDQGAPSVTMSARQAFEVALASEQRALAFFEDALTRVTDPEVEALFARLREEEAGHVRLVQDALAVLPARADEPVEQDEDEYPSL